MHDAVAQDGYEALRALIVRLDSVVPIDAALRESIARGEERFVLRFVRDGLATAAARRRLCIAIDDLQRGGAALTSALAYLVDRLQDAPLVWHFASRSESTIEALAPLLRQRLLELHELPPLDRPETLRLVAATNPKIDRELAEAIYAQSGGNPLFAELLAQAPDVAAAATLRTVIEERLESVPNRERRLALAIATGGHPTFERLISAFRYEPVALTNGIRTLVQARIIDVHGDAPAESLRFRHDLLAEATIARASVRSRRAAYDAWFRLAADGRERIRTLDGAGRHDELIDELLGESWRTAEAGGIDAAALAERALHLLPPLDPRTWEAHAARARAILEDGNFEFAQAEFARFVNGKSSMRREDFERCYARYAIAAAPQVGRSGLPDLDELCEAAGADSSTNYPSLAHARMLLLYCEAQVELALATIRDAREASATSSERLRHEMWEAYLCAQIDASEGDRCMRVLADAAHRAEAMDLTSEAARACFMCAFVTHRAGDLTAAETWTRRGLGIRDPKPRSVTAALRSQLCEYLLVRGDAREALGILLEAYHDVAFMRRDARATVLAVMAFAQALTGSLATAHRTLAGIETDGLAAVVHHSVETIRGAIAEIASQHADAIRAYDVVIASATIAETSLDYALAGRARIALTTGDDATLARLESRTETTSSRLVPALRSILAGDGLALDAIRSDIRTMPTAFDMASTYLAVGDRTGDRDCLRFAVEGFERIGTTSLIDRSRASARRHGFRLRATQHRGAMLGERQRAVALGIAAGSTNAEIAADLHLSARTVEKYVSSLLEFYGVRSRVDIATIVQRGRLDVDRPRDAP